MKCNCFPYDNSFFLISDAAKLDSTLEDMTVYTALEFSVDLSVKFHINPVSNYKVTWFLGDSEVQDTYISNIEKGEHVQTTYSISNVTKPQLGNYTVRVINQAIIGEPNEATFIVVLQLRGERNKVIKVYDTLE